MIDTADRDLRMEAKRTSVAGAARCRRDPGLIEGRCGERVGWRKGEATTVAWFDDVYASLSQATLDACFLVGIQTSPCLA